MNPFRPLAASGSRELLEELGRTSTWSLEQDDADSVDNLHIYGVIGGFWGDIDPAAIVPALRSSSATEIHVYINSPGGDVYDGIAIRNALAQHPARIVTHVDGLAASAASFIATAGDEVVMGRNSELMIHDAWTIALGNAGELRDVADQLDRISDNIAAMYADKAGGDAADWRALMLAETWYSAEEAVEAGLADRVDGEQQEAAASFDLSIYAHAGRASAPAPLRAAAMAHNRKENPVNRAQLAAALAAGTITQAQYDASIASLEAIEGAAPQDRASVPGEVAAGPDLPDRQPEAVSTVDRPLSVADVANRLAEAYDHMSGSLSPVQRVQNALADVIPADDEGNAFVNREDWTGQVWRATEAERPWVDAIGEPQQMTRLRGRGWRWGKDAVDPEDPELPGTPEVAEYAGNKTDIPTNEIGTKEVTFGSFRIAGGWDFDRAVFDFADPEWWAAFLEAGTNDYKIKSNAAVRTRILAAATDTPTADVDETAAGGISAVLKQLRRDIRSTRGGRANRIFLGDTLFDMIEDLPEDKQPLWLRNATVGLGPEEGTAAVGQLHIVNDPSLTALQAVVFDSRGLRIKERSPFWIEAQNIPKGGVDVAVFSYLRLEVHDPRVIVKRDYAA